MFIASGLPTIALAQFLWKAGGRMSGDHPLFPTTIKGGGAVSDNKMLYSLARESLLSIFKEMGWEGCRLGWHSLRSGAATEADRGGATLEDIMRHGRWVSLGGIGPYVDKEEERKLQVSKCLLGLL